MNKQDEEISEKFWSNVQVKGSDECWPWIGGTNSSPYGQLRVQGKHEGAHRVAYWLAHGVFPYNTNIRHTCDNPICCNPDHLIEGTHADNMEDMARKGRSSGGRSGKFYAGEIWLIRRLRVVQWSRPGFTRYRFSTGFVAKMFKTYPGTILNIWNSEEYLCKEGYYI